MHAPAKREDRRFGWDPPIGLFGFDPLVLIQGKWETTQNARSLVQITKQCKADYNSVGIWLWVSTNGTILGYVHHPF